MDPKAKKNAAKKLLGATLVLALVFQGNSAYARILFENDQIGNFQPEMLKLGSDDAGANNTSVQFGADITGSENGTIVWNIATNRFGVDHALDIVGGLTSTGAVSLGDNTGAVAVNSSSWDVSSAGAASGLTGLVSTGTVDFSGAGRLALPQGGANPATCVKGDEFFNSTDSFVYICASTNTWARMGAETDAATLGGLSASQFLRSDASANFTSGTLTTSVGTTLAVNGTLSATNGATLGGAAINLNDSSNNAVNLATGTSTGAVSVGGGSGAVAVNSSSWDVSSAGAASGLTGLVSTGTVDFSGASSFRIPQASSDPGTCAVGQEYFNTTTNTVKTCASTNTWSSSTTGTNYVFAYDTTTQTVSVANTFQDITFNNNAQLNGWTHTAGTAGFTAPVTGLYSVSYTGIIQKTGALVAETAELRALFNGTEVAGSQLAQDLDSASVPQVISKSFILSATSGQVLKFQLTSSGTTTQLLSGGSNATTRPSATVSIIRIN